MKTLALNASSNGGDASRVGKDAAIIQQRTFYPTFSVPTRDASPPLEVAFRASVLLELAFRASVLLAVAFRAAHF